MPCTPVWVHYSIFTPLDAPAMPSHRNFIFSVIAFPSISPTARSGSRFCSLFIGSAHRFCLAIICRDLPPDRSVFGRAALLHCGSRNQYKSNICIFLLVWICLVSTFSPQNIFCHWHSLSWVYTCRTYSSPSSASLRINWIDYSPEASYGRNITSSSFISLVAFLLSYMSTSARSKVP